MKALDVMVRNVITVKPDDRDRPPHLRTIPDGWRPEGFAGTRAACLAHIDAAWTDMRPRSVREAMTTRSQE